MLVPRGGLALISTPWWGREPAIPESAEALLREPYSRFYDQRRAPWDETFDNSPFEPLRYESFEEAITFEVDASLELYSTTSPVAALSTDERARSYGHGP